MFIAFININTGISIFIIESLGHQSHGLQDENFVFKPDIRAFLFPV